MDKELRRHSESLKRAVVDEIESGRMNRSDASKEYGILKDEFNLDAVFENFEQMRRAVAKAIVTYNTKRTHWSLDLRTPEEVYDRAA